MLYLPGAAPKPTPDEAIPGNSLATLDPTAPDAQPLRLLNKPDEGMLGDEPVSAPSRVLAPTPAPKFQTSLRLTPEQENNLVNRAIRRIEEVKHEIGLEPNGYVQPASWLGIRQRNQASYDNDYSWRILLGGIFEKSNLSLGTNTRHVRYLAGRVQDDMLGTVPFFAAMGKNPDKQDLAKQIEEFIQGEIERSPVRKGLRAAQRTALIVNEAVVKTSYHRDATKFWGPATVMVGPDGRPLKTPGKQEYIFEHDDFLPHPAVDGLMLLEKDPSFEMTEGQFAFQHMPELEQVAVRYEGVKSESLDYRCFLCPLRYESIHEADINVHLYRSSPSALRERYANFEVGDNYFQWYDQTGDKTPREHFGEHHDWTSDIVMEVTVAEVYIRCDANGDHQDEEILLVLDLDRGRPLFYDYLHNHFERRPFEVVPGLEHIPGRWYGRGVFSLGEDQELHIDAEFNRAQVKGSRSSAITFRQPNAVKEWANGGPTVVGNGDIHDLTSDRFDREKNPPIFTVNLAEDNDKAMELMEISRVASDSVIGTTSTADAARSGLNRSETLGENQAIQQAADVITKATEEDQAEGINRVLEQVVICILENMDRTKLLLNKDATELVTLNRNEVRGMRKDVRLLLTRSRSTQLLMTAERSLAVAMQYRQMMMTDPEGARLMRPMFIDQLKALEVNSSDEVCPEITDEQIAQFQAAQMQQQAILQQQDAEMHAAKVEKTLQPAAKPQKAAAA